MHVQIYSGIIRVREYTHIQNILDHWNIQNIQNSGMFLSQSILYSDPTVYL